MDIVWRYRTIGQTIGEWTDWIFGTIPKDLLQNSNYEIEIQQLVQPLDSYDDDFALLSSEVDFVAKRLAGESF